MGIVESGWVVSRGSRRYEDSRFRNYTTTTESMSMQRGGKSSPQRISLGSVNRSNMSVMLHMYMVAHDVTAERAFEMIIKQTADTRDFSLANNKDVFAMNFKSTSTKATYMPTSEEVHAYMAEHKVDQATAFVALKDKRIVSSLSMELASHS